MSSVHGNYFFFRGRASNFSKRIDLASKDRPQERMSAAVKEKVGKGRRGEDCVITLECGHCSNTPFAEGTQFYTVLQGISEIY